MLAPAGRSPEESLFWSKVDIDSVHWHYLGDDLTVAEAREKAWTYVYAPVPPKYHLEVWCEDETCIRHHHIFIGRLDQVTHAVRKRQADKRARSIELQIDRRKKVTDDDVDKIRELKAQGHRITEIAKLFGISTMVAHNIAIGKTRNVRADPITGRRYMKEVDNSKYGITGEEETILEDVLCQEQAKDSREDAEET